MGNVTHDKDDLAAIITTMSFGKLMQVAHELVSMVAEANIDTPGCRDISTPVGMAEMLFDWAESQDED